MPLNPTLPLFPICLKGMGRMLAACSLTCLCACVQQALPPSASPPAAEALAAPQLPDPGAHAALTPAATLPEQDQTSAPAPAAKGMIATAPGLKSTEREAALAEIHDAVAQMTQEVRAQQQVTQLPDGSWMATMPTMHVMTSSITTEGEAQTVCVSNADELSTANEQGAGK